MARRPKPAVVYDIKERIDPNGSVRHIVRWRVAGRPGTPPSRSFMDLGQAEAFCADLIDANNEYERFDLVTGLPVSMIEDDDLTIAEWCKAFMARDAGSYVPKSRQNLSEDLVPLIARSAPDRAPTLTPRQLAELDRWLAGRAELSPELGRWLKRWSPRLRDLQRTDLVRILERVSLRQDLVAPLAPSTQSNRRTHVRQVLNDAVTNGKVKALDWPPAKRGGKKKSERPKPKARKVVVSSADLSGVIEASSNRDRRSRPYRVMTASSGLGGFRPSEVFGFEVSDLCLPADGWGAVTISESRVGRSLRWAMDGDLEYDEPKSMNSTRTVPIPPQLVAILREHLAETGITEGRLFPGGVGFKHWPDSLALACRKAGVKRMSPYDLRRAYASHLHLNGFADTKISARMGNTVEILRKHYLFDVDDTDDEANEKLEEFYVKGCS